MFYSMEPAVLTGRIFGLDAQLLFDLGIQAIAVFILFFAVGYILINPVRKALEARQEKVKSDLANAAKDREDAEKNIEVGDLVAFEGFYEENEQAVITKALDDRVGCLVLIEMIKSKLPYDMYFTFVVQEEVGLRGAKTASYTVDPDFAIVVETTTAADIPNVEEGKQVCRLGEGAVISFMDRRTIYDKELYKEAFKAAERAGVKAQAKQAVAGGNDAGVINISKGGVRTIAVSLPCRYLHAPHTTAYKEDINAVFETVNELAGTIAGGKF